MKNEVSGLTNAGIVLSTIVYVILSLTIIGLIFTIPGFIANSNLKKDPSKKTFAGVWALIFGGLLSGIFILVG